MKSNAMRKGLCFRLRNLRYLHVCLIECLIECVLGAYWMSHCVPEEVANGFN